MGWFSGTKPKVTQMPAWSPEQQSMSGLLSQYLTGQMGGQPTTYPGMAGLTTPTGMEKESLGLLEQYIGGTDPMAMQSEELLKKLMAGESGIDPEVMKRYLSTVVYGPAKQRFEEETLPGIAGAYGKGGAYFSTMRGAAETKAGGQFSEEMNRIAAEMAYKQLEDRLARQAGAMQTGLAYTPGKIATGMQYGGLERELQTLPYMDWLKSQERQKQQQSTLMQQMQAYLGQQPYQNVVTPGQAGAGQSIMSMLPYLLLSDVNLKENFEDVDNEDILDKLNKINIKKWNFKSDEIKHIGPMAQDFYKAFELGESDKYINAIDIIGTMLCAIQQLTNEIKELKNARTMFNL